MVLYLFRYLVHRLFLWLFIYLLMTTKHCSPTGRCLSWGWVYASHSCSSAPGTTPSLPWWSLAVSTSISSSAGEWSVVAAETDGRRGRGDVCAGWRGGGVFLICPHTHTHSRFLIRAVSRIWDMPGLGSLGQNQSEIGVALWAMADA